MLVTSSVALLLIAVSFLDTPYRQLHKRQRGPSLPRALIPMIAARLSPLPPWMLRLLLSLLMLAALWTQSSALITASTHPRSAACLDLNGVPVTVSPLLARYAHTMWNWTGYLIADGSRFLQANTNYNYTADLTHLAAVGLYAQLDMETDEVCQGHLQDAIAAGLASQAKVDEALRRALSTRFRLNLFDPPASVPFLALNLSNIDEPASRALAYRLAVDSAVLLKNDGLLPLDGTAPTLRRVAIVGPNANRSAVLLANYEGCQLSSGGVNPACRLVTPLMGLISRLTAVNAQRERLSLTPVQWTFDEAVDANSNDTARIAALLNVDAADVCIAFMGLDISLEAEAHDRPNCSDLVSRVPSRTAWPPLPRPLSS